MSRLGVGIGRGLVVMSALASFVVALWLGGGGHLSLDSVQHVYEAHVGRSVSTQPPMMAAVLAWLGAGQDPSRAVSLLVALLAVAMALGLLMPLAARPEAIRPQLALPIAVIAPLSPLLLLYPGVLWKDVAFASLLALAAGLAAFVQLSQATRWRWAAAFGVVALASLLALLRPQGLVLWPLLVGCVCWSMANSSQRVVGGVVALFGGSLLFAMLVSAAVEGSIPEHDGRSTRAALVNLIRFDLAGMETSSDGLILSGAAAPSPSAREAREHYSPDRGDGLSRAETYVAWLRGKSDPELIALWGRSIASHPRAYLEHRVGAALWLWGARDPRVCLPAHLGVEGIPEQLASLGITPGMRERDREIYAVAQPWFGSPVFRPVTYLIVLALAAAIALRRRSGAERRVVVGFFVLAASYGTATSMVSFACDLRYLYPIVPLASLAWIVLAFRWRPLDSPERAMPPASGSG